MLRIAPTKARHRAGRCFPSQASRGSFSPWAGEGQDALRIATLIPMSGAAGLWGPSSLACATLAAEAWNQDGGHRGREVRLTVVDASDESLTLEDEIEQLCGDGDIDAIVGMHTSSVRERVTGRIAAAGGMPVPFIYTPLYEGGALPAGVEAIGETPQHQLLPAVAWLTDRYRVRRWFLVGNDYCWPRQTHSMASRRLSEAGCEVVGNRFLPLGACDPERLVDEIRASRADAVLMSLIGQDAIEFSRAFGASGLASRVLRLSCAIEENGLLAIGADATEGLFVASGYFASLPTDANAAFRERYWHRFGDRGAVLNSLGQSLYEGVSFLRGRLEGHRLPSDGAIDFDSVRGTHWRGNAASRMPIYLAQADGLRFDVVRTLSR